MPEKPKTEPQPKIPAVNYHAEIMSLSDAEAIKTFLNAMGADGWELVALRQIGFARDLYIFKRSPAS